MSFLQSIQHGRTNYFLKKNYDVLFHSEFDGKISDIRGSWSIGTSFKLDNDSTRRFKLSNYYIENKKSGTKFYQIAKIEDRIFKDENSNILFLINNKEIYIIKLLK